MSTLKSDIPKSVLIAAFLLLAGLAFGITRAVIEYSQSNEGITSEYLIFIAVLVLLYLLLVFFILRGKNWIRLVFLILIIVGVPTSYIEATRNYATEPVESILTYLQTALWLVVVGLLYLPSSSIWFRGVPSLGSARPSGSNELICANCGYQGKAKRITKGSIILEIVLWLMLLLPGLIYSIWRLASRYKGCPQCGAGHMIPVDSPKGRELVDELS